MRYACLLCLPLLAFATACARPDVSAERGRTLYLSWGCAACHGPAGGGDGPAAATAKIKPRDLRKGSSFTNGSSPEAIAITIKRGMTATGMPGYPELADDEIRAMAAWIHSIRKEKR